MVQRLVNIVLQGAGIVAPATSTTSVLNIETEIPQGIPALFEYSRLHKKMSVLDKLAAKLSLGRQFAQKPEVRLAAAACGLLYVSRSRIVPILSSIGDEMNGELLDWFDPSRTTATLTATELRQMSDDADDTEKRIDYLETQLAKAQNALEVEKTGHEETKRDLHRQTTSRANVEVELESLRAELEPGKSAEDDNPELKTIEEAEEESEAASLPEQGHAQADPTAGDAQVERLQKQLEAEQTNYRFVFKKKEVFRQGGLKLKNELEKLKADYQKLEDGTEIKKDLDKLQADFNVLEDSRDTWQEKYEALEQQAGVQVLETSSEELDKEDETETTNEAEDEEPIDWKAAYERLQIEFADLNERHDQLNAERAGTAEHTDESQQQSQKIEFDPLYDISDHGDDEGDDRDGSEGHEENQGHEDDTPAQSLPPPTPTILNAMAAAFTPAAVASRVDTPESSAMIPAESLISSSMNAGEPLSPHPPAPKATGSGHVRNAHVRAVNEDVMRKSWRRNSGMPDRDEEVVLAPEDRMEIGS